MTSGREGRGISPYPEINKTLEKHINLIINLMVRLFIKEATTHTSSAVEMFADETSRDLKGPCVMPKTDACTVDRKLI